MLFNFSNGLTRFERYINKIMAEKLDILFFIYLNNILINMKDSGQK